MHPPKHPVDFVKFVLKRNWYLILIGLIGLQCVVHPRDVGELFLNDGYSHYDFIANSGVVLAWIGFGLSTLNVMRAFAQAGYPAMLIAPLLRARSSIAANRSRKKLLEFKQLLDAGAINRFEYEELTKGLKERLKETS